MLMAAALFVAGGTTASAQFTNSASGSSAGVNTDGWNTVYFQWNPSSFKIDNESESFTGLSLGWSKAFSVSKSAPVFVEAGVGLQYSFKSWDDEDFNDEMEEYDTSLKIKFSMFSLKVPVNIMYKWDIPNSKVSLIPYAGLNFRFNITAKEKYDFSGDYAEEAEEIFEDYGYILDANLFDKDDMGEDGTWNRFQIGWQIGVNARFNNKFLVGVSYGTDFSEIADDCKIKTTSITLGYCF